MLICQQASQDQPDIQTEEDYDWLAVSRSYPNIEEATSFISQE